MLLVEQALPLEVAQFDDIAIDQGRLADPGPHKQGRLHGPQRTDSHDHRPRPGEPLLAVRADLRQQPLARIAVAGLHVYPDGCSSRPTRS